MRDRIKADWYSLAADLVRNWWVILMAGGTVFLCFQILFLTGWQSVYTSSATVMVTGTARSGDSFTTYSRQAEPFIGILTDSFLVQEVTEELGITQEKAVVRARVIAETNLIALEAQTDCPASAYRVLKGILDHYRELSDVMLPGYYLKELIAPSYPSGAERASIPEQFCIPCIWIVMGMLSCLIGMLSWQSDTIRNREEAVQKLHTRILGVISHERKLQEPGQNRIGKRTVLINSPTAGSGFVEGYEQLRERLLLHCEKYHRKVIMITSIYENEGKSTAAANLALALARRSDKVLLLDADLRKPAQYRIFQREGKERGTLAAYLRGQTVMEKVACHREKSGFYLICSEESCSDSTELAGGKQMEALIRAFRQRMEYIIIDTPPLSLLADAEETASFADEILLVVKAGQADRDTVNDMIDLLGSRRETPPMCMLNNVHTVSGVVSQYLTAGSAKAWMMNLIRSVRIQQKWGEERTGRAAGGQDRDVDG